MEENPSRTLLAAVVTVFIVGGAILLALVFMGGQTSTILSTVGGAVNAPEGGGGTGDTTGNGPEPGGSGSGSGGQVADAEATVPTLLIIRTGEVQFEVLDLDAAVRDGDAAVLRAGGYVSDSTRTTSEGDESANVTYRIPSASWDTTLGALHGLSSKVDSEQIKTEEVTGQVVDLTARIANLGATEAALQAIMAKATKISDVLDVQEQLTATRGEIEQLVAKQQQLEGQASFGSLGVRFHLPAAPAPAVTAAPGWDPGSDVTRASAKLVSIGQASTSIGIWLAIVGLPLLIGAMVITVVGWQVYRLARWLVRRRDAAVSQGT